MTIDGISFKNLSFKKADKKESKETQVPESISENTGKPKKTVLSSLRNNSAALYMHLLMSGGMIGSGLGSLTSCSKDIIQEQYNYNDQSALLKEMQEQKDLLRQMLAQLQLLTTLVEQNNSQNKEIIKLLTDKTNAIISILGTITGSLDEMKEQISIAVNQIIDVIKQGNENDKELQIKIDAILSNGKDQTEQLKLLVALATEMNTNIGKLVELGESIKDSNSSLSDTVNKLLQEYTNNSKSYTELMKKMYAAILNNGEISADILAKLQDIILGGQTDSAKLDAIIKLLESIDAKLGKLVVASESLGKYLPEFSAQLTQLLKQHAEGKLTDHALMSQMLELMKANADKDNENNEAYFKLLNEISQKITNGQMSVEEGFNQVTDILNKMNGNLEVIAGSVKDLSVSIDKLGDKFDQNHDDILDQLTKLNNGVGSIDSKLDKILAKQDVNNETLNEISTKIDMTNGYLNQINAKTISLDEVKNMLGDFFNVIGGKLDIISGNQVSVEQLEELMEKYKTDLTKTNGLIENLTSVVKNLNLGEGLGSEFQKVIDAIVDFKNQENLSNEAQMEAYRNIMEELMKLNGGMEALGATLTEINTNLVAFAQQAKENGTLMGEKMQEVINGQTESKAAMDAYAEKYIAALNKAEGARMEQIALLQALVDKETGGNGGLTQEQLEESLGKINVNIPDYKDLLQEISDKIGKVITSDDLQNFFINTKPDLTKICGLVENLTSVLKNKDFTIQGNLTVNAAELEKLVGEMTDYIKNMKTPSEEQLKALIALASQIADNTKQNPDATAYVRSNDMKSSKQFQERMENLQAAVRALNLEVAKAQGTADFQTDARMFRLNA